jgi:hypothetical protein
VSNPFGSHSKALAGQQLLLKPKIGIVLSAGLRRRVERQATCRLLAMVP